MDDADQFLCGLRRRGTIRLIHDAFSNMVFDDFRDEAIQCAAAGRSLLKHGSAAGPVLQRSFHRFHLSTDTVQAFQQLRFFFVQVEMTS